MFLLFLLLKVMLKLMKLLLQEEKEKFYMKLENQNMILICNSLKHKFLSVIKSL